MLKIIIRCLALSLFVWASSFASPDVGAKKAKGEYTHIYIVALDLNVWSSEKVVSIGGLKLASPLFIKAKVEDGFVMHFEGGYSVRLDGNKLFYGDSLVGVGADERNIYVTPKDYQLGVFIRLFDKE